MVYFKTSLQKVVTLMAYLSNGFWSFVVVIAVLSSGCERCGDGGECPPSAITYKYSTISSDDSSCKMIGETPIGDLGAETSDSEFFADNADVKKADKHPTKEIIATVPVPGGTPLPNAHSTSLPLMENLVTAVETAIETLERGDLCER